MTHLIHRRGALGLLAVLTLFGAACWSSPPAPTPTVVPTSVVAAASPVASASPIPTRPLPTLAPPASPTPRPLVVYGTGGDGVSMRSEPSTSAERVKVLAEGTTVTPLGQDREADGRTWRQVRDSESAEGWVAADFLVDPATATAQPAPIATAAPAVVPTQAGPTATFPALRPTFTPGTAPAPEKPGAPPAPPATAVPTSGATAAPKPATPTAAATSPAAPSTPTPNRR